VVRIGDESQNGVSDAGAGDHEKEEGSADDATEPLLCCGLLKVVGGASHTGRSTRQPCGRDPEHDRDDVEQVMHQRWIPDPGNAAWPVYGDLTQGLTSRLA
jgi:hypothetical protein